MIRIALSSLAFSLALAACAGTQEPPAPPPPPVDPAAFNGPPRPPAANVDVSADLDGAVVWADSGTPAPATPAAVSATGPGDAAVAAHR